MIELKFVEIIFEIVMCFDIVFWVGFWIVVEDMVDYVWDVNYDIVNG